MPKLALIFALAATAVLGQYKSETAGGAPSTLPAGYSALVQLDGRRIMGPKGIWCEIWTRLDIPAGPPSTEQNVTFTNVPVGALVGVIRFPNAGSDRRGQTIPAGTYSMRYADFPVNGDHQGVAPQRDFAVLSKVTDDPDPNSKPTFEQLMDLSRKASGTRHPLVLSIWKSDDTTPGFSKQGENDWVLQTMLGKTPLSIILVGKAE